MRRSVRITCAMISPGVRVARSDLLKAVGAAKSSVSATLAGLIVGYAVKVRVWSPLPLVKFLTRRVAMVCSWTAKTASS